MIRISVINIKKGISSQVILILLMNFPNRHLLGLHIAAKREIC